MNKYQEALNEMYAVLNDSQRWYEKKDLLQELVDRATPQKPNEKKCPNCGESHWMQWYCANCGQKIDWREE